MFSVCIPKTCTRQAGKEQDVRQQLASTQASGISGMTQYRGEMVNIILLKSISGPLYRITQKIENHDIG